MKPQIKQYFLRMSLGFAGYAAGLFGLDYYYTPEAPYRYLLILLPLVPLIYVSFAIVRCVSEMDEMWKKIAIEAMAFSGFATGFTCLIYLFLRDMGAPEFHAEWAFYLMWIYYKVGAIFSWRRYR
jgi:hypothetical protein